MAQTGVSRTRLIGAIRQLDEALKAHMVTLDESDAGGTQIISYGQPIKSQASLKRLAVQQKFRRKSVQIQPTSNSSETVNLALEDFEQQKIEKVTVYLRIIFYKIGTIDTIHDRYQAEVIIQARWREPRLDGAVQKEETIEWDKYWNPRLSVENAIGEPKDHTTLSITYDLTKRATICENRRITGTFFEYMELNHFPFDSQDLTVTLLSDCDASEVELVHNFSDQCSVNKDSFTAEQEWYLHRLVNVWKKTTIKKVNNVQYRFPGFSAAAKVSRRPQFFIWNIIVVMCLISSLTFVTFVVNVATPQSRLPLTFILVLTTVTFKFVVNKSLPRISYLTYLDKYILGTMIILCSICIWHAIAGSILYTSTRSIIIGGSTSTATTSPSTTAVSRTLTDTNNTMISTTTTTTQATSSVIVCPGYTNPPAAPPGSLAILIDRIACGVLGFIYIGFHFVFIVLITCVNKCTNEMAPNIEVEAE